MRPTWDEWGLGIAASVATRADCSRSQVGAVIVTREHRIVATGYNGAPSGQPGCLTDGACPRAQTNVEPGTSYRNCISTHAEMNAVIRASWDDMDGSTMYVTREPCPDCAKVLAATPLIRAVWPEGAVAL